MLPGKGKHGLKRSGKGGKVMPSCSKSKDITPARVKLESVEERETSPSTLPVIRILDNSRILPRLTAVIGRSRDDGVGVEDLDTLQLELESLLSCAALRHRALLEEIVQIYRKNLIQLKQNPKDKTRANWKEKMASQSPTESAEERRDKKSKVVAMKPMVASPSSVKRGPGRSEDRPSKKLKEAIKPEFPPSGGKLNKAKVPDYPSRDSPKPETPKAVVHKNDTPNKFWASVDPYCSQISSDDMAYLSDLIRTREEERHSDLYSIPPLGKHYSIRWAEEDLGDDVKRPQQLGGTAGPMTQRLVSALVEDKVSGLSDGGGGGRELSGTRAAAVRHVQSLSFERRVREELREQGILDGDEAPKEQADDELLLEMKRVQSELKALSSHNLQRLRHLQALAEAQVERQELKKKLLIIDTELLNIYASKQKKKHITKKEREQAWRYIKERETIVKHLYPNLGS